MENVLQDLMKPGSDIIAIAPVYDGHHAGARVCSYDGAQSADLNVRTRVNAQNAVTHIVRCVFAIGMSDDDIRGHFRIHGGFVTVCKKHGSFGKSSLFSDADKTSVMEDLEDGFDIEHCSGDCCGGGNTASPAKILEVIH